MAKPKVPARTPVISSPQSGAARCIIGPIRTPATKAITTERLRESAKSNNIKMVVDMEEIMSAEKLTELAEEVQVDEITKESLLICKNKSDVVSFRISCRRQNKNFKYNSNEVNSIVGEQVCKKFDFSVNLNNPDLDIIVEIVNNSVFIGTNKFNAFGGLPVGTGERALSLISSGIDSPVASFNIIKRGVELDYIHFHSAPTTSRQSVYNVISILTLMSLIKQFVFLYLNRIFVIKIIFSITDDIIV